MGIFAERVAAVAHHGAPTLLFDLSSPPAKSLRLAVEDRGPSANSRYRPRRREIKNNTIIIVVARGAG